MKRPNQRRPHPLFIQAPGGMAYKAKPVNIITRSLKAVVYRECAFRHTLFPYLFFNLCSPFLKPAFGHIFVIDLVKEQSDINTVDKGWRLVE